MTEFRTNREVRFDEDRITLAGAIDFADEDFIRLVREDEIVELYGDFSFGFFGDIDGRLDEYFLFDRFLTGPDFLIYSIEDIGVDIDRFEDSAASIDPVDEYVTLFRGADLIVLSGGDDRINGFGGRDDIDGGDGADTLIGGGGADTLKGGAGADRLTGAAGADLIFGGLGADSLNGGAADDALFGGGGRDTLRGFGDEDRLSGQGGADLLRGGGGDDELTGGGGADTLRGEGGADRITPGGGRDVIFGGAGRDVLVFTPSSGRDEIRDFRQGADRIEIAAAGGIEDLDIAQAGRDVTISFRRLEITVTNSDADDFGAADFIF